MKHLFYLCLALATVLYCSSCENFARGEYEPEIELDDEPVVNFDNDQVLFSDSVKDEEDSPVANAEVSVYASGKRYSEKTGSDGKYEIFVPANELPQIGYISLSIIKDNYVPYNSVYAAPLLGGETYGNETGEVVLAPCEDCLIIGEKSSELFHLGDDNYNGPENSQFQKTTDGTLIEIDVQPEPYESIKVSFQAKGLQPSRFDENQKASVQIFGAGGMIVEEVLVDAPEDGSFGTYEFIVDNTDPITQISFVTRNKGPQGSDYDDWEFTCLFAEGLH